LAYAHSKNQHGQWHELVDHLRGTAILAARFASPLGAADLGRCLGLWHDLGKFNPRWQQYLEASASNPSLRGHGPDHKAAGSLLVTDSQPGLTALLIQGHHGGLRSPDDFRTWLTEKRSDPATLEALRLASGVLAEVASPPKSAVPEYVRHDKSAAELFLRMLFSALVDADFLDTERHFSSDRAESRVSDIDLSALLGRFERERQQFAAGQRPTTGYASEVAQARSAVYEDCIRAAAQPPGLFRLTVPTGGGKTRSGMAFALHHAVRHRLRRIVVAVPFITITEQTAEVYRGIFESQDGVQPVVLEHHSGAVGDSTDDDDMSDVTVRTRLAAENWDAPVIVTTTVQLFESLFANKTSRTRKLHRLANSVIILDEAQALPAHLLTPALDVLQQLVRHYGTTVVFSTATQPAFEAIPTFASIALTEIIHDPGVWFERLQRVRYEWRVDPAMSWQAVAGLMDDERQALAVVNTKKDAFALLDALNDPDALHLSTMLCGAHRRGVIEEIRRRLRVGSPCRLISTQIIEAGVDLDFPVVLRAIGPLDSVIQAAGRCNREGLLGHEGGRVIVFRPAEGGMPLGVYRTATGVTAALEPNNAKPDRPEVLRRYFQQFFSVIDTDRKNIQSRRAEFDYPEVARRFQLVDDDTEAVAVTKYGTPEERAQVRRWLEGLRGGGADARWRMQRLQPYLVSVRCREAERYRRQGLIDEIVPGIGEWQGGYDRVRGLAADRLDLETLVV
jgi:CRISPR-associated endonuclease/helicase Cas3